MRKSLIFCEKEMVRSDCYPSRHRGLCLKPGGPGRQATQETPSPAHRRGPSRCPVGPKSSLVLGLLVFASCSSERERVPVYPVRGELFVEGQPAEGALVIFHRNSPSDPSTTNPNGRVQADGSFQLTTYESDDGAPAGEYAVTIFWPEPPESPVDHPDMGPDRLKNRYTNPEVSEIGVTVAEEDNVLAPIRLQ